MCYVYLTVKKQNQNYVILEETYYNALKSAIT